ncbi:allantoate amidohydrolase [Yinghuangia sp. ASG 101]|uniref:allantoate amidohydrolase n=1 Tax=Yinghuangia sp. ASG 101 TaxID=2896848 RepID=UPI003FCCF1DC
MWAELAPIGRDATGGGYRRFAWTAADLACRAWFRAQAERRGLVYELDRNGNQWAWFAGPDAAPERDGGESTAVPARDVPRGNGGGEGGDGAPRHGTGPARGTAPEEDDGERREGRRSGGGSAAGADQPRSGAGVGPPPLGRDRSGTGGPGGGPPGSGASAGASPGAFDGGRGRAAVAPRSWSPAMARDAVVTGSHLDSVPDGGAFDGPLGVASAFAAFDRLIAGDAVFRRPFAVVNFADEEGARFGVACVGSRLAAGVLTADQAHALRDGDGVSLPDAMAAAGHDPAALGADPELLGRIGCFVELHIEQGRALADRGTPVGVASAIWPHGRWRFDFRGTADHAGTTRLEDRRDPMLTYATTVLAARKKARLAGALATFGKVTVEPNATNAIASLVRGWLDARAPAEDVLDRVVAETAHAARERAGRDGTAVEVVRESYTPAVAFAGPLRDRIARCLGDAPVLPTGAGHDAGVLSAVLPTAMLFVRNPTGVSHSPAEFAEPSDRLAGVDALTAVLAGLLADGHPRTDEEPRPNKEPTA